MKNLHSISCYNHTAIEQEISKKEVMMRFIRNLQFANNDSMRNVFLSIIHSLIEWFIIKCSIAPSLYLWLSIKCNTNITYYWSIIP